MFALCFVSAVLLSEEEEGDDKGVEEVENEAAEAVVPGAVEEEDDNAGVEDGVCIKRTLELWSLLRVGYLAVVEVVVPLVLLEYFIVGTGAKVSGEGDDDPLNL